MISLMDLVRILNTLLDDEDNGANLDWMCDRVNQQIRPAEIGRVYGSGRVQLVKNELGNPI